MRFFGRSGQNRLQNAHSVIYNHRCDGAWCSGSTWASDSHCVGSIPIAPANANTLTCEGVSFCPNILCACAKTCGWAKRNVHAVCLHWVQSERQRKHVIDVHYYSVIQTYFALAQKRVVGQKETCTQCVCVEYNRSDNGSTCNILHDSLFSFSLAYPRRK